ncbi:hypothetical protein ACFFX0_09010 [Citricoccus parietis]|uniref:Uncharacterized protein n=1 Tax=Citricoccus parietis TaxID=592307 RepID=A0ABV5FXC5_9MICC
MDGVADHLRGHAAEVDLAEEPIHAEFAAQIEDLLGDLPGAADHQGAAARCELLHLGAVDVEAAAAVRLR